MIKRLFLLVPLLACVACHSQSGSGFGGSGFNVNNPLNPNFPNANATQQAQNLVAGCNGNVPSAMCQDANVGHTTFQYSVASGVVTITLTNAMGTAFPVNSYVAISGCTVATNLNGLLLKVNNSTTTSSVVGTVVNTQNFVQTPANVSLTSETNCYLQGPGWQPFYLGPFPAPNTYSCGAQGNGAVACSATGTPAAVNSWVAGDWSLANPNGGAPALPIVLLTDLNSFSSNALFCGITGETNDNCISLEDGNSPTIGQFYGVRKNGGSHMFTHGHWDPVGCGGNPCFLNDLPSSANWYQPFASNYICGFSRNLNNRPGLNQSIIYCYYFGASGSGPGSNFDPLLYKCTLTYNGNASPITGSCSQVYDIGTCPGWGYTSLGSGSDCSGTGSCLGTSLAATTQLRVDNFDNIVALGLGAGGQGTLNRHMQFAVSLTQNKCASHDTAGFSGTNLGEVDYTPGSQGTGFAVNDTVSATSGGCTFTETVTQVSAGKVLQLLSVNTTTSSAITSVGQGITFTVASDTGMFVGQDIYIDTGSNLDNATITSCGTSTPLASCTSTSITATLSNTHSSGVRVVSQSVNNSGCAHTYNITPTSTSGSGNIGVGGLRLDIESQGVPTNSTVWPFISSASCPLGTTTTCETPIVPTVGGYGNQPVTPYGIHSGNCDASGSFCYVSGHGSTWQTVNANGYVQWDMVNKILYGETNGGLGCHQAIGFKARGCADYPYYVNVTLPNGGSCVTVGNPTCLKAFTFPTTCNTNPGGSDNHSSWTSVDNGTAYAWYITSTFNNNFTMTDPPNVTCGYMFKFFGITQSGPTALFSNWYTNYNNRGTENFQCAQGIYGADPHGKFVLGLSDMYSGFNGNTGFGTSADPGNPPFCGMFAYTTGQVTH